MSEPIDWGREVEETEASYTQHLKDVMDRPREIKEEKRGISEVSVKKGLPIGITRKISEYIGKTKKGGKKRKTRRGGKKKTHRRRK